MSEVSGSTEVPKETSDDVASAGARASCERTETTETTSTTGENAEGTQLATDDVQRAIEGLAEIPDDQLQEFFNDKDFMEGLNVVDAWEGDTDSKPQSRSSRNRDRDRAKSPRERPRRDRRSPYNRDRSKREEKKRDDLRRDPSKSSKDIERDKMRTKSDTARKILAEKEKAIKNLLDSDNVVPPGTEVEAIQDITDKQQNNERGQTKGGRRSRDRRRSQDRRPPLSPSRRRSGDRIRLSPNRRISDERRQPRATPERRRSWERRASRDRSIERHRRREERELRLAARRSRSRDRQRSRSPERYRKRWSRSPNGRRASPRRHSRSRSPERRARKRSPFINEITRQLGKEGLMQGGQTSSFLPGIPPLINAGFAQEQVTPVPPPSAPLQQFMHHPGQPGAGMHMQTVGGQPFANFDLGPPMNFEPGRGPLLHTPNYSAVPMMYNQGNPPRPIIGPPMLSMPVNSPQPVPAPTTNESNLAMSFNQTRCPANIPLEASMQQKHHRLDPTGRRAKSPKSSLLSYNDLGPSSASYKDSGTNRLDRLKTPEPPVISASKPFEKTSLSSLLEASVSAKDSSTLPVLYPGFKPEILRECEQALRDLPPEDLRLKVKGRFFFDPRKEDSQRALEDSVSNSILLRSGQRRLLWEETEMRSKSGTETSKQSVEMHQKICQTDEPERHCKAVQASIMPKTAEFCQQVYPNDLQQAAKEEKRPIMDRLDWDVRETYDYAPTIREADDLRWSLSNSSQKQRPAWNRGLSPATLIEDDRHLSSSPVVQLDHGSSRGISVGTTARATRDSYSYEHHRSSSREHYSRERFSPTYRRSSVERQEDFHDVRSNHSRGESPMALEESPDEIEVLDDERFSRGSSDWRPPRGSATFPPTSALQKLRSLRGKLTGRPYRARGGFRGKF